MNAGRYPAFLRHEGPEQAVRGLRRRLGDAVIDAAVEEGAAVPFPAAVALARTAIRRDSGPGV